MFPSHRRLSRLTKGFPDSTCVYECLDAAFPALTLSKDME